ncbi:MAG: ABC transporter ATP-binding protein [Lachnospiraceae bacterium]|nr:ABC transporter ATP-binding protein [Lachnospiraceae bacterium]
MLLLSVIGAASALLAPVLLSLSSRSDGGISTGALLIVLAVMLFAMIPGVAVVLLRERFALRFNCENTTNCLRSLLRCNYDYLTEKGCANLVERCSMAVGDLYAYMTDGAIKIIRAVIIISAVLLLFLILNPVLAVVMAAVLPLNYFGYRLLNRKLAERSVTLQTECAAGFQTILSYIGQTDYLKQCATHEEMLTQMQPAIRRIYKSTADINVFAGSASLVLSSLNDICRTLVMILLVRNYLNGTASVAAMIVVTILFPVYFQQVSVLTNTHLDKQKLKASESFLREIEEEKETEGTEVLERVTQMSFDLDTLRIGDSVLAENIRDSFVPGDIVHIAGKSGAGKSTLAKLLAGFRGTEGISLNSTEIGALRKDSLRSRVTYLSQQVPVVTGTLMDNLFLNRRRESETEQFFRNEPLLQPLYRTHSPDGEITEGGANLSGGEKQRIAIARILPEPADVLILDEVTSNIDAESTADILNRVTDVFQNSIIFIITHDPLAASYATKTLTLDQSNGA